MTRASTVWSESLSYLICIPAVARAITSCWRSRQPALGLVAVCSGLRSRVRSGSSRNVLGSGWLKPANSGVIRPSWCVSLLVPTARRSPPSAHTSTSAVPARGRRGWRNLLRPGASLRLRALNVHISQAPALVSNRRPQRRRCQAAVRTRIDFAAWSSGKPRSTSSLRRGPSAGLTYRPHCDLPTRRGTS